MDLKFATTVVIIDVIEIVTGQCHQVCQTYKFKCGDQAAAPVATVAAADRHLDQVVHTW